ncbi:glycosyltransferase family 25 protein [Colletotrichum tofieldiae]|uniref:Glycosyltransferase family 25 protein n=1 Tax=Colletotrichum tofieldiae TaxID=708197 RepID=A0A161Y4M0_9PEZI|nr:glycosyltransferase family 25 protein [Colletotrichum tofieldiae]GKT53006.1 glycosyltransferase family 25 protein [Colletotrichum tofieldiae]GKT80600.1 glycosyltransferase family 25 protein [Colletotrichum tofieldiae]
MPFLPGRLASKRDLCIIGAVFITIVLLLHNPFLDRVRQRRGGTASASLMSSIQNSTLGFEKIFVVGLPSRTDRRDGILLQAALSEMAIDFVDGVEGKTVPDKAIPKTSEHDRLSDGAIGCWRGHMNALEEIVRRNLSSALILEDDADWDIRIRQQLHDFALATQALTQPLLGAPSSYVDPSYPRSTENSPGTVPDISFNHLPATVAPKISPYGDDWDLLWIGHCGMHFPFADAKNIVPKARVIHANDVTVAPKKNLWTLNIPFTLKEKYPEHTRAVHHVQEGVCTLGYAVSQKGARRLLQEVALKDVSDAVDILLRFFCEGSKGRRPHNCLTTQPAFFHHHRAAGPMSSMSDIGDHGGGVRETSMTDMVRWSVRLNADALLEGRTDFVDQYPDAR